jgi:hypothetical protein
LYHEKGEKNGSCRRKILRLCAQCEVWVRKKLAPRDGFTEWLLMGGGQKGKKCGKRSEIISFKKRSATTEPLPHCPHPQRYVGFSLAYYRDR